MTDDNERLESMLGAYHEMRRRLTETAATVQSTTVTAESRDGLVRATVGGGGELTDLWLDPQRYRRVDAEPLARAIRSTIGQARRRFTEQAAAQYRSVLGASFDPERLTAGNEEQAADQVRQTARHVFGS